MIMVKNAKMAFKVLAVFYCLLCNLTLATNSPGVTEEEKSSRLVLITSLPETFNANGELIRKNKAFPLRTLSKTDIDAITEGAEGAATKAIEGIYDTYIKNPSDETSELLYLLNCRNKKDERALVYKTANKFKISENYKVSPLKLFFIGYVSNSIDLDWEDLVENKAFAQNILEDYTDALMGKMPKKIVVQHSDSCLDLLKSEIELSMKRLGIISQIDMIFFWNSVLSYMDAVNNYKVSAYNTEVISAYNLIYSYLSKTFDCATSRGLIQLKNLIRLNENVMNMQKKCELAHPEDQSLKKLFYEYKNGDSDDKKLNALNNLLSMMDKMSIADISNGFALYKIENNMFTSMHSKMEILTEEIQKLVLCFSKLLLLKNN